MSISRSTTRPGTPSRAQLSTETVTEKSPMPTDTSTRALRLRSSWACLHALNTRDGTSESAELYHCVALNRELEARGDSKPFALASPFPAAVMGLTGVEHPSFQFYYFDGIPVRRYVNDKLLKPKKLSPKHAVPLSTTQEESWWRLPDGLDEKEQRYVPGFPFGTDDMAPWQWDEQRKRPVLYWKTTEKKSE